MTLHQIKSAVCDTLHITEDGLRSKSKLRAVQEPRHIALALAYTFRDELNLCERDICRYFSHRCGGAAKLAYGNVMHRFRNDAEYAAIVREVCAKLKGQTK